MARNKFDVDETLGEKFSLKHARRLLAYVRPYAPLMILTLVLMLISSTLALMAPLIFKNAIDVRIPAGDSRGVIYLGALLLGIFIINGVIQKFRIRAMTGMGQKIIAKLRDDLFSHLQTLPLSYFDSRPHGKIMARVINYVNALSDLLSNGIINLVTDLFSIIVIVFFMWFIDWRLTAIAMGGFALFAGILFILRSPLHRAWQNFSAKQSNLNAYIHESIAGIKVTKSFAREWENQRIFEKQAGAVRDFWLHAKALDLFVWPMVEIISIISTCVIFLAGAAWIGKSATVGALVAFLAYIWAFWQPVINMSNFFNAITNAAAYVERIFETMDEKPTVSDLPGAREMPWIEGRVEFKNVTFSYDGDENILENVSFNVSPGESIALVGPTGAGKTTIINLLSRFYDISGGEILIDGINIKNVKLKSLRRQMGVMLQDTFIFSGTIMDNIRYSKPGAEDEEVVAAAKAAAAHDFIITLEDGYQTQVNERGSRLSMGQRQLISFARALLADPRILILDEATANIDTQTEISLQKGLETLLKGRTSFVTAHRLSTIKRADKIMYISNKGIIESGTHAELILRDGPYRRMFTAQFSLSK